MAEPFIEDVAPCLAHGIPAYSDELGWVHVATGARCIGPDAARDARVADRRRREHTRIVAAFERFLRETYARPDEDPHDIYHDVFQPERICAESDGVYTEGASYRRVAHKSDYGASDLEEIDRNARAYGWEVGHRGVAPMTITDASADNPFLDPKWREAVDTDNTPKSHYGVTDCRDHNDHADCDIMCPSHVCAVQHDEGPDHSVDACLVFDGKRCARCARLQLAVLGPEQRNAQACPYDCGHTDCPVHGPEDVDPRDVPPGY